MIAYMFACLLLVLVVLFMAVPLGFAWLLVASGGGLTPVVVFVIRVADFCLSMMFSWY